MQELERFAGVVSWLDQARWATGEWWEGWQEEGPKNLASAQKVLAHWVTYVTDMRMPARTVWTKGLPVFAKIVGDYTAGAHPSDLLSDYYGKPLPPLPKVPTLVITGTQLEFTPRYKWQYNQIGRTLELLVDYNGSLVEFMKFFIERYVDAPEALRRLAHALYILTYVNPKDYPKEDAKHLLSLNNKEKLDAHFQRWKNTTTSGGQKRLWAALRDYLKHKGLRKCIEETFPWPAQNFELSQLELPGDIWNDVFTGRLLYPLAEGAGIQTRKPGAKRLVNSPTLARRIYEAIRAADLGTEFYPEQLDVSFDFASRMCDKDLCDICIFGGNKAVDFCAKPGPVKLCSVLLIMTGYRRSCEEQECPVINAAGAGLCSSAPATR